MQELNIKKILFTMALLIVNIISLWAQGNKLYIPDVTAGMDNTATLCINMDNEHEIAGMQFTLSLPGQVSLSVEQAKLSDRGTGHSLSMRKLKEGTYRVIVISLDNSTIKQGSGTIIEVPMSINGKLEDDTDYPIELSQVILADKDGNACDCTTSSGTIQPFRFPDCSGASLSISPNELTIEEAAGGSVRFMLMHEGYAAKDETFTVSSTADSRVTLPSTVTIRQGETGAYFYAEIHPDKKLNNGNSIEISISGESHQEACANIVIEDDTKPKLTLTAGKVDIAEGETVVFTVTSEVETAEDYTVEIKCNKPSRFDFPANVVIPAGSVSADVEVKAIDDNTPDVENVVTFTAYASGYIPSSADIFLVDDDVPTLHLSLSKDAISESAGIQSVVATLSRTDNIDKAVTVKLSDDSEGALYYSHKTVKMAAGTSSVDILLGVLDNKIVDGERTYNISAGVYIASCSCNVGSGGSGGVVTVPLTIYDNDGPVLSLHAASTVIAEGGETQIEVRRNADFDTPLTIVFSSDNAGKIDVPANVVIPAGESRANFTVTAKKNTDIGDGLTVTITASADGFSSANTSISITDRTLPDAQIISIKATDPIVTAGGSVGIVVEVLNSGLSPIPSDCRIDIYSTTSNNPVATLYTKKEIAIGETQALEVAQTLPENIGFNSFYAKVNGDRSFTEIDYSNNTSNMAVVKTESPYSTEIKTGKALYSQGETVKISGELKGNGVANKNVEVYVINGGYRHSIATTSNENGSFTADYTPYSSQNGHFSVGACFPGEGKSDEQTSFDIYGMNVVSGKYSTHIVALGDSQDGNFRISNSGKLGLTGIKTEITSCPEGCEINIDCPESISGNSTISISYTIKPNTLSSGNNYEKIALRVTSEQGVDANYYVYYYCVNKQGTLRANIEQINTTITKGSSRDYGFTITNAGEGETGNITFSLPSWMTTAMPFTLPSLKHGESAEVTIRMSQTDDMQLNVPVSGKIGINCSNGTGISLPFVIKPVSDVNGILIVDACDDYTYNTAEAPHLAGATVTVKNPVTSALVCQGVTGDDGIYSVSIPEGYYLVEVTHEKHNSYSRRVLVSPEEDMKVVANLTLQTVSITYELHETEEPDVYRIETVVKCETNVPAPSIDIKTIGTINSEEMELGESRVVTVVVTNNGFIEANGFQLDFPADNDEFSVVPLSYPNIDTLAPNETVELNFMFTKKEKEGEQDTDQEREQDTDQGGDNEGEQGGDNDGGHDVTPQNPDESFWWENLERTEFNNCLANFAWHYWYRCGTDIRDNHGALALAVRACTAINITNAIIETNRQIAEAFRNYYNWPSGDGGANGNEGDPGPGPVYPPTTGREPYTNEDLRDVIYIDDPGICDPCVAEIANVIVERTVGQYGIAGEIVNEFSRMHQEYAESESLNEGEDSVPAPNYNDYMATIAIILARRMADDEVADIMEEIMNDLETMEDLINACGDNADANPNVARNVSPRSRFSWKDEYDATAAQYSEYLENFRSLLLELYGDDVWVTNIDSEKQAFFDQLSIMTAPLKLDELLSIKPKSVSTAQLTAFVERMNNTYKGSTASNRIDMDKANQYSGRIKELDDYAEEQGYESMEGMHGAAYEKFIDNLDVASASVCANVEMKFAQTAVLTRQAFEGTLTIGNDMTSEIKDISVNLDVTDENGKVATSHEMQMNIEETTGFTGTMNDGLALTAKSSGVIKVKYIPTKYAAPEESMKYVFSGTVSYYDTSTDLVVTRDIVPVVMTVNPSPILELNYFMQRDVLGDDPLTKDVVEPSKDAEFSILINNNGYGDANNLQFYTNAPEITVNEKGIDWKFWMTGASLNGETTTMQLGGSDVVDFGNIHAHGSAYAQWYFRSSLLGHFTSYDTSVTHLTSYGNPDLSLIDKVSIHELTRSIQPEMSNENKVAFLVNDITDSEDIPDAMYFTDGKVENVYKVENAKIDMNTGKTAVLNITPSALGWNYGCIADPTGGKAQLNKITRKDGVQIPLRNFWQTDRTLRDGKEPLYENVIHFVDECVSSSGVTYILEFQQRDDTYTMEWDLQEGWNWISSCLNESVDILSHFDNVSCVLSQTSNLFDDPQVGYVGDVTKIMPGQSYKMNVNERCGATFSGYKVDLMSSPINLKAGWNWISYPLCISATVNTLFSYAEEGDVVASQEGFAQYAEGNWEGSLKTMETGKGYLYKSISDKSLSMNNVELVNQTSHSTDNVDIHKYPNTMNIVARITGVDKNENDEDYIIYAMVGNECRGVSVKVGTNYYITIHGDTKTDISFIVENKTTGIISMSDRTIEFVEDIVGSRELPFAISISDITGIHNINASNKGMCIYSIEGILIHPDATVDSLKSLPQGVYIVNGKKYVIR